MWNPPVEKRNRDIKAKKAKIDREKRRGERTWGGVVGRNTGDQGRKKGLFNSPGSVQRRGEDIDREVGRPRAHGGKRSGHILAGEAERGGSSRKKHKRMMRKNGGRTPEAYIQGPEVQEGREKLEKPRILTKKKVKKE